MWAPVDNFFFVLLLSLNSGIIEHSVVVIELVFEIDVILHNFESRFFLVVRLEIEDWLDMILWQFWIDWRFSFFLSFLFPFFQLFWNSEILVRNLPKSLVFFQKIVDLSFAGLVILVCFEIQDILVLLVLLYLILWVLEVVWITIAIKSSFITHNLTFADFFEHMKAAL
jgi:hypothetical protein